MRLAESIEKSGNFWLHSNPEEKLPGTLTISNGGAIRVEIVGNFGGEKGHFSDDENLERVIGEIEKYGLVTLEDCHYSEKNFSFGGISKSSIQASTAFLGIAYDKDEVPTFDSLEFAIDCSEDWLGITGISVKHDVDNRTATINYQPIEKMIYRLSESVELYIGFSYTLPGSSFPVKEAKITQGCYFEVRTSTLVELDDLTDVAYKVLNFVSFAVDRTVSVKNMAVSSSAIIRDLGEGKTRPVHIPLYYKSVPFVESEPVFKSSDILFGFSKVKYNFEDCLKNWFAGYASFAPALSLYFSTKNGGQKHLEGKFLALAQALETYHRRTSKEVLMDEQVFLSLVDTIIDSAPKDNIDWLKGRLQHGNEINLRKRIVRIIEPFKSLLGNGSQRSKLINKIVDTRNYLTHYSEELHSSAAKGRDIWILCLKMEAIFQLTLLGIIGFSSEEIKEIVKNSRPIGFKLSES